MWYLISLLNPDVKYALLVEKEYVVGRKDCDIIAGDPSVSRKHATLEVSHTPTNVSNPSRLSILLIKDVSKYGCYVNKVKVTDKEGQILNDGDEVIFGTKSAYTVVYEPFIISTSCLNTTAKKNVHKLVCLLGGHIVNDWQRECSLLVMNTIRVTIKVITAMVALKHIVTPDYLEQYVRYLQGGNDEPDPTKFLPEILEPQINPSEVSFQCNPKRRTVFEGMTFIFLDPKKYKKMSLAVELGGGTSILMEEGSGGDDKILVQKGTVVMNCDVNDTQSQSGQEWIQYVQKYLKKHKKHLIQEAELGYAVLFCSTENHCNPDLDFLSQMLNKQIPSQSLSQAEILAANTEATQASVQSRKRRATNDPETIDETRFPGVNNDSKKEKATKKLQDMEASSSNAADIEKQKRLAKRSPSPTTSSERPTKLRKRSPSPVPPTDRKTRSRSPSPVPSSEKQAKFRKRTPSPTPGGGKGNKRGRNSEQETDSEFAFGRTVKQEIVTPNKSFGGKKSQQETDSEFAFGRTIKQEIVTPNKSFSNRKDQNMDENVDIKPHGKSDLDESQKTSKWSQIQKPGPSVFDSIQVSSQQKDKNTISSHSRKVKLEMFDDPDEGKRKKKRNIIEDSDEDEVVVPKRTRRHEIKEDVDDDLFEPRQHKQNSQTVNKLKLSKKEEIREDSDEEEITHKNKIRKRQLNHSDDDDDIFGSHSNRRNKKLDRDNDETRNNKKFQKSDVDSDDFFSNQIDRKPISIKSDRAQENSSNQHRTNLTDKHRNDDRKRNISHTSQAEEEEEREDVSNQRKHNKVNHETTAGFLTTIKPIEDQVCRTTEHTKEEDLPTNCVITEFVALVSRKKKTTMQEVDGSVPSGFVKWKGKLVKNFKKFKKTGHAGANTLPRIIGGRDLEVHIGSQRKEIDDWFKEAMETESQQSEANRRATDLFEWDPTRAGGKKRSR